MSTEASVQTVASSPKSALLGANTLICGGTGTGKTHCLGTFIEAGITPFIIFTEPGMRTLADIPCPKLHWRYVKPASVSFEDLIDNATKIGGMSFKSLTGLSDMNRKKYQQLMQVLQAAHNFTCDRCGQSFGDVSEWNTDRAICLDSLSGLSRMAMDLVVGAKPVKNQADWGVAMDNLERILNKFTDDTRCHYVLISHLAREKDEITGSVINMPSTLGQKLPPKVPLSFDDVIMAKQKGGKFTWSTVDNNTELKSRNLPLGEGFPASFVPLIDSWKKAGGVIEPTEGCDNT